MRAWWMARLLGTGLLVASCQDNKSVCGAGASQPCVCEDGRPGTQDCANDGTSFLACVCADADAGATDVDAGALDAAADLGTADVRATGPDVRRPYLPVGSPCTVDDDCSGNGSYFCGNDAVPGFRFCTASCVEDNLHPENEEPQCNGETCLSLGDGAGAISICAKSCSPSAAAGTSRACRAGFVCTRWARTHDTLFREVAGCWPFCGSDADCAPGLHCNVRLGECGDHGYNAAGLPDGTPCTLPTGPSSPNPCRGTCRRWVGSHGICGSFLPNPRAPGAACPDDPTHVRALMDEDDNLAACVVRTCVNDCDCVAPAQCISGGQITLPICAFVDPSDPGETTHPPASGHCP